VGAALAARRTRDEGDPVGQLGHTRTLHQSRIMINGYGESVLRTVVAS
jgi:hypothetical protein